MQYSMAMYRLRVVNGENVANPEVVPSSAAIYLPEDDLYLRPYRMHPDGTYPPAVRGLDRTGADAHTHIDRWPGLRYEGRVSTRDDSRHRAAVSFDYYKTDPNTGLLETTRRLVLVDRDRPYAFGVLLPENGAAPTGHEGEKPTWYIRGQKLGSLALGEDAQLGSRIAELDADAPTYSFSMARMLGGAIGDPLDPTFRAAMGIQEVPLPAEFRQ